MRLPIVKGNRAELATVDLKTGTLYVDATRWDRLPAVTRRFVELHEQAHYDAQSTDELLADKLAYADFIAEGYRPDDALKALRTVLTATSAANQQRLDFMSRRIFRTLNS
jgi:hypothetical protein